MRYRLPAAVIADDIGSAKASGHRPSDAKTRITGRAHELGFDLVGFTDASPFLSTMRVFQDRVDDGLLSQWRYTAKDVRERCTPEDALAGARTIVCTATSYAVGDRPHDPTAPGLRGAISCHSWGHDYHRVIGARLRELARFIGEAYPGERCVPCVDTGPLVDRAAAVRAGIGWFGRNGNVLTKRFGSWVLLGELITTLAIEPDEPVETNCGTCPVCIDRCPTKAIGDDGSVDARRCISDLTQLKTPIPRELRAAIGNRLWGCDDCQTPCPVNESETVAAHHASAGSPFSPLPDIGTSMDLTAVLGMTKSQFRTWFGPTSMAWRGKSVLQRNAAVALGNSRDARAVPHLVAALEDRKPLVRGHAAWALGRLGGDEARDALSKRLDVEDDVWVREEVELALGSARAGAVARGPQSFTPSHKPHRPRRA